MARHEIEWVFDELPPSGARRGGEPAAHAFGHGLETFVREVIQNANDQADASASPELRFTLMDLEGPALTKFRQAIDWRRLHGHLVGASRTPTPAGQRLAEFLAEHEASDKLRLCRVDDRHTVGLTGDEDGERSHFRALCKDTLFSIKSSEGAGGSYGLGKSVLWAFSGLASVVFASELSEHSPGQRSPRLIGRSELPFHEVEGQGFMGPGWFGKRVELGEGRVRAESVWAARASQLAAKLELAREPKITGTSLLVLGFRDPTCEAEASLEELADRLRRGAIEWFWPAMQPDHRGLSLVVDGQPIELASQPSVAAFVDAWRRRAEPRERLQVPGDVVRVAIPIEVPRTRAGGRKHEGVVDLIVRLADEADEADEAPRRLAMFRGPGMVVAQREYGRLAGLRPFHALLACGEGRVPEQPSEADRAIEQFLRASEPPGHDRWEVTPALRDGWQRGYASVIPQLWDRVARALRELLAPVAEVGAPGPERLRKRFALGRSGGSKSSSSGPFSVRELAAELVEGRWSFSGRVQPRRRAQAWQATIELHSCGEDGSAVEQLDIAELWLEPVVEFELLEGRACLHVSADVPFVNFRGVTREFDSAITGELGLRVVAQEQA